MRKHWLIGLILFSLAAVAAMAQTDAIQPARKKIGLVLEGGGALGLAHIGVIEWLEDNHVPVDYIAGTSMGGLIGGMYAMGYSPGEIRDTIGLIDWDAVLYDRSDYSDLPYRRKQDRRTYPTTLDFGLSKGLHLPEGFNAGHRVGLILDNITRPYSDLRSFDDLPIPFRCVGVDMVTATKDVFGNKNENVSGQEVVLKAGSLSQALRSTMSIPGFFSPVREEKKLYIDGGVLDNLPVEVVQDMGADIIIAVHLDTGKFDPSKDISLLDVAFRSISVVVNANENKSLARLDKERDVEVSVPLSKFKSGDYGKKKQPQIMDEGSRAAQSNMEKLRALSLGPAEWENYRQARAKKDLHKLKDQPVTPAAQEIAADDPSAADEARHGLSDYKGKPLTDTKVKQLEKELNRMVASGEFARMGYRIGQIDGQPDLVITASKRERELDIIPVLAIDGSDYRSPIFTLGARATLFDLGGTGSEWRSDILLGSQYGLTSEYYRPFDTFSHWFFAPRITAETSPFDIYNRLTDIANYQLRTVSAAFDLGYNFSRNAEVRLGYEGGTMKLSRTIGAPVLPFSSDRVGTTSLKFSLDRLRFLLHRLEAPVVPRDGAEFTSKIQWHDGWLGANHHFPTADADLGLFKSVNEDGSVYMKAAAGSTLGFTNNGLPSFSLGNPLRLAAYGTNEFLTNQFFYGRAGYVHRVYASESVLGGGIYVTGSYELAKPYGIPGAPTLPMDATAGVILDYAVGPIFLGGSVGESGHRKLFFYLGKLF
jgi:NTE family protein